MPLGRWLSKSPPGVISAWFWAIVALGLAVAMAWLPIARIFDASDPEGDELQCRSQYQQAYAKLNAAAEPKDQAPTKAKEDADAEKAARDYCIQRRAAIAGERQADTAKGAALISFFALAAAIAAAIFAGRAAKLTADAAKASEDALVVSQRPWLSVVPRLGNTGLQFHVRPELRVTILLALRNNGRSPADNIQIFAKFCPLRADARAAFAALRADAKAGKETAIPLRYKPIFPEDTEIYPLPIILRSVDIVRDLPRIGVNNGHRWIEPAIVGCILYKSPFAPQKVHDSGFIAALVDGTDPRVGRPFDVSQQGHLLAGEIPAWQLRLENVFFPSSLS
jgi:hypothetical protein